MFKKLSTIIPRSSLKFHHNNKLLTSQCFSHNNTTVANKSTTTSVLKKNWNPTITKRYPLLSTIINNSNNNKHTSCQQQFSTSLTSRGKQAAEEGNVAKEEPVEEKKSFIGNVVEFIGEFLGDFAAMIFWRLVIFATPILFGVWYYFGTSGVKTACYFAWMFVVAMFVGPPATADAQSSEKSQVNK